MGITWGVWLSPTAQQRANWVCVAFGIGLLAVSLGALGGASTVDTNAAREAENKMWKMKIHSGELDEKKSLHKRAGAHDDHKVTTKN
jgi:succinate dehydrogenase / fumarate reductase cytochrome b subunit